MDNETKLKALNWWQNYPYFHEYTCCHHTTMVPKEIESEVVLECPTCKKTQNWSLDTAYEAYRNRKAIEESHKGLPK